MNKCSVLRVTLGVALLASSACLSAQTEGPLPSTQVPASNATGTVPDTTGSGMTPAMARDKVFLRKAAQGGMAEVELGRLAAEKGSAEEVKSFGQKMVSDHSAMNEEMKPIAEAMGVMLPRKLSRKDQMEKDKLGGLSGEAFDNEYLNYMVKDHREDLREFRAEAASVQDPTLKAAVQKGVAIIREHTMMVTKLAKAKGVVTSPTPRTAGI